MKDFCKHMNCHESIAVWISIATVFLVYIGSARADVGTGPAMWSVSDDDNEVYLFGTFHLLPEDANWQTAAVIAAMDTSPITVTEADISSPEALAAMQQLIMQHGVNPPGTTLSTVVGEERAQQLFAIAAQLNLPPAALQPLRPWLAVLSVTQAAYVAEGFNPALGVEQGVIAAAKADGDAIGHLETLERQITAMASLEDDNMLEFFDMSIEDFAELGEQLEGGLSAWLNGDIDGLNAIMVQELRDTSPAAFDALFTSRNSEWVVQILDYLDGDTDTFVAVGAGHLVGDDSVIDMLRGKGLDVRRIQ